MASFDVAAAQALLQEAAVPWIRELDLEALEVSDELAILRMSASQSLCSDEGIICGQALMSLADLTMMVAVAAASGGYRPMKTASISVHFQKPSYSAAMICTARITQMGRAKAFGQLTMKGEGEDDAAVLATVAYTLLGSVEHRDKTSTG